MEGEIAGSDADLFAIRDVIVEIAAEIRIFGLIKCCCAHVLPFVWVFAMNLAYDCSTNVGFGNSLVRIGGIGDELEIEAGVFRGLIIEIFLNSARDRIREVGDTVGYFGIFGIAYERDDIADFGFDIGAVAVFFDRVAAEDGGGALVLAEGFADGAIAAAQNPIDDFALRHSIEVVGAEIFLHDHGMDDIGEELEGSAGFVAVVIGEEREREFDEFFADVLVDETEFGDTIFVFQYSDIVIEIAHLGEIPSLIEEEAVREGVFEAIGGEIGDGIVGDGIEMIIGDFAGEDVVLGEEAHDTLRIADNLAGAGFGGFLDFRVAIHVVDGVFESGRSNVVIEAGDGLFLVVGEFPDNECDADAMGEDGIEIWELVKAAVIDAGHGDFVEALELGDSDVFQEPGREIGTKNAQIFAILDGERAEALFATGGDVEGFLEVGLAAFE